MGFDVNNIIVIGRLTRDPELSYTPNNKEICKFSIANNRGKYQDNEIVNFFNITVWGNIAKTCAQYLKKGAQVCITGELRQNRWQNEEGKNQSRLEITGHSVQFIGGKNNDNGNEIPPTGQTGQQQTGQQQTGQQQTGQQQPPGYESDPIPLEAFEDDEPF